MLIYEVHRNLQNVILIYAGVYFDRCHLCETVHQISENCIIDEILLGILIYLTMAVI